MEFDGQFETHVTARADGPAGVEALRAWADRRSIKFHHIVLDRGRTPSQPMVTRQGTGTLTGQLAAAAELARELAGDGFAVGRVKVEAAPGNRDIPATDAEAGRHAGRYFEHHVKLALPADADLGALAELAARHGARLSRNARRRRDDGTSERFVTQRCHGVGLATARRDFDALRATLAAAGYVAVKVEQEYVVSDSNLADDAGWLDATPPAGDLEGSP